MPGHHPEQTPAFLAGADKLEVAAQDLGVKVHALLWAAPEHVAYAVLEAESLAAVARYVFTLPLQQEFKVTPVQNLQEVVAMGKAMMAQAQR